MLFRPAFHSQNQRQRDRRARRLQMLTAIALFRCMASRIVRRKAQDYSSVEDVVSLRLIDFEASQPFMHVQNEIVAVIFRRRSTHRRRDHAVRRWLWPRRD
jgi:hypothetical protein